jgi:sulfonate transport system substrate-binding protein
MGESFMNHWLRRRDLLLLGAAGAVACTDQTPSKALPVRLGIALQPGALLFILAREKRFFEQAGLLPSYQVFPSGKRALRNGLLTDQVDVVSASDLPVVQAVLQERNVMVLAKMQSVRSLNSIVARADRGVRRVIDLPTKRVATQRDSAVHFFLDRALTIHGVPLASVEKLYLPIETLVETLVLGDVDAISIREPYVTQAKARLQEKAVVLEVPWAYPQYELLVSKRAFAPDHALVLQRVLQALLMAEDYLHRNPEQAQQVLAKVLGVSVKTMTSILQQTSNRLRLGDDLLPVLTDQAAWLDPSSRLDASEPLLSAIEPRYLRAVRALRVGV